MLCAPHLLRRAPGAPAVADRLHNPGIQIDPATPDNPDNPDNPDILAVLDIRSSGICRFKSNI
jgi:hypothetical protein